MKGQSEGVRDWRHLSVVQVEQGCPGGGGSVLAGPGGVLEGAELVFTNNL